MSDTERTCEGCDVCQTAYCCWVLSPAWLEEWQPLKSGLVARINVQGTFVSGIVAEVRDGALQDVKNKPIINSIADEVQHLILLDAAGNVVDRVHYVPTFVETVDGKEAERTDL